MPLPDDILQRHVETLYVLDARGDLLTSNEPHVPYRRRAPVMHLGWSSLDHVLCFRDDVPGESRARVQELVARHWPFREGEWPPEHERFVEILRAYGEGRRGTGPAFIVPEGPLPPGDATAIAPDNEHLLAKAPAAGSVAASQPIFAVVVDGRAVSSCWTVRRSAHGIEAGLDTLEEHRRRGYARRATAAWCRAARAAGLIGFYSTGRGNVASLAVAASLGLVPIGMEFTVR